jgi:hypothetical protein
MQGPAPWEASAARLAGARGAGLGQGLFIAPRLPVEGELPSFDGATGQLNSPPRDPGRPARESHPFGNQLRPALYVADAQGASGIILLAKANTVSLK